MAGTFKFELVSPERVLLSGDAEQVLVPGADGDFTVFAGHAPVISIVRPGIIDARLAGGKTARIYIKGGFAEVQPDHLTILAERAIDVAALDSATLAREIKSAEDALASAKDDEARFVASNAVASLKSLSAA